MINIEKSEIKYEMFFFTSILMIGTVEKGESITDWWEVDSNLQHNILK